MEQPKAKKCKLEVIFEDVGDSRPHCEHGKFVAACFRRPIVATLDLGLSVLPYSYVIINRAITTI